MTGLDQRSPTNPMPFRPKSSLLTLERSRKPLVRFFMPLSVLAVGTGFGPVAYGPHWPRLPPPASLAPTSLACPHRPRLPPWQRGGLGSDARHWSPDVILGFAEYALSFPIYIRLSFSLSLLFRQSLLYDSQFNISIRTRLISTLAQISPMQPQS